MKVDIFLLGRDDRKLHLVKRNVPHKVAVRTCKTVRHDTPMSDHYLVLIPSSFYATSSMRPELSAALDES